MTVNENKCKKCRYYIVHYIKEGSSLMPIDGHCINRKLRELHPRKPFRLWENCEYWEPMEIQIGERRNRIEQVLKGIEDRLHQIVMILESDQKSE